mgnify:CR=1 FL=1
MAFLELLAAGAWTRVIAPQRGKHARGWLACTIGINPFPVETAKGRFLVMAGQVTAQQKPGDEFDHARLIARLTARSGENIKTRKFRIARPFARL